MTGWASDAAAALFPAPPPPPAGVGPVQAAAITHLDALRTSGLIQAEHEVDAALVLHLAGLLDRTGKGYAAANVSKEYREALDRLPSQDAGDSWDALRRWLSVDQATEHPEDEWTA